MWLSKIHMEGPVDKALKYVKVKYREIKFHPITGHEGQEGK